METLKSIEGAILHNKVPGEEATVLKTDQVEVLLNRLEKWELDGKSFEIPERSTFVKLPKDFRNAQDLMSGDDGVNSYDAILDAHVSLKNIYNLCRSQFLTTLLICYIKKGKIDR